MIHSLPRPAHCVTHHCGCECRERTVEALAHAAQMMARKFVRESPEAFQEASQLIAEACRDLGYLVIDEGGR